MKTAGHAVLASGVTVAISLLALVVVPVPFLRSMGFGGMLIPLVSVAVVLTLLPAMLSKIGPKVDWPRIRHEGIASRGWTAWARGIVKHRWAATVAAVAILAVLIAPVFSLKIGQADIDSLAKGGDPFDQLHVLTDAGVGDGVLTPIEVLVPPDQADAAVAAARGVDGVQVAVIGGTSGDLTVIDVLPDEATLESSSIKVVDDVRAAVEGAVDGEVLRRRAGGRSGRLLHRGLRPIPVRAGDHRLHHARAADAHVPVVDPADQGRDLELDLDGGSVRRHRVLLADWATGPRRSSTSRPPAPSRSGSR